MLEQLQLLSNQILSQKIPEYKRFFFDKITLQINDAVLDKFMAMLKRFPDKDIIIENPTFESEREILHETLRQIDSGEAKMISEDELWESTDNVINSHL